jgi:hypothetical protein
MPAKISPAPIAATPLMRERIRALGPLDVLEIVVTEGSSEIRVEADG